MRPISFALALLACCCDPAFASYSAVLSTPNRVLVIVVACPEGEVHCENVKLTSVEKATGTTLSLTGSDWVRLCPDDAPCQHLGFKFDCGGKTYYVADNGNLLVVGHEGKPSIDENGTWIER